MLPTVARGLSAAVALSLCACGGSGAAGDGAEGGSGGSAGNASGGSKAAGGAPPNGGAAGNLNPGPVPTIPGRTLIFQEEFDGPQGSEPNSEIWNYDTGTGDNGWGNGELQYYTNRLQNVALDGQGHLRIVAQRESFQGSDFTSARLHTQGKFDRLYGRVEARIRLPQGGKGVWPAFWTLGSNRQSVGWPACGELDIMENRGSEPGVSHGSAHGPGYSGGEAWTSLFRLPMPQVFSSDYHTFAIEWTAEQVRWFVDDNFYNLMTPANLVAQGAEWVFDGPMFLILNVAVGGNFDGNPEASTPFPQTMYVDHIRIYE